MRQHTQYFDDLSSRPGSLCPRSKKVSLANLFLSLGGTGLLVYGYGSLFPIFAGLVFYTPSELLLNIPKLFGKWERRAFRRMFSIGWFMLGVGGMYAEVFGDPLQLSADAYHFFRLASDQVAGLNIEEIRALSEGAFAIVLWGKVYDLFSLMGFPRERYIGGLVNVTAIAFGVVFAVKTAILIFGNDDRRIRLLLALFSFNGIIWMFAGIHLRDGMVFLAVAALTLQCGSFLNRPSIGIKFAIFTLALVTSGAFLSLLRTEFFFVPMVMAAACAFAILFELRPDRSRQAKLVLSALSVPVISLLAYFYGTDLTNSVSGGHEGYINHLSAQQADDSLAMRWIADAPTPLRAILGTIYLYIFPVPVWSGFLSNSAVDLFRSVNAISFYFVIPLLLLGIIRVTGSRVAREPPILFLLCISLGFSIAVALTSLENRHLGAFLAPILLFALVPDLSREPVRRNYRTLLSAFLVATFAIHIFWILIKI